MATFAFSVILDGLDLDDITALDALYTDQFDIYPGTSDGVSALDFVIDAPSGETALALALGHLSRFENLKPVRIDEDLVNTSEIAVRLDVTRETARLWTTGARLDGFPAHRTIVGTQKIWAWADVFAWAQACNKIPDGDAFRPLDAGCVTYFNGRLVAAGQHRSTRPVWETVERSVSSGVEEWNAVTLSIHGRTRALSVASLSRYNARSGEDWVWNTQEQVPVRA